MKQTKSISLAMQSFVIELDAYEALSEYLKAISERLSDDTRESMEDIEDRVAELFREKLSSPMMVITLRHVGEVMEQVGYPSDFGDKRNNCSSQADCDTADSSKRRMERPRSGRVFAGVCAAIANFFEIDVVLVRLVTFMLFAVGGLSLFAYIIFWLVIPEQRFE